VGKLLGCNVGTSVEPARSFFFTLGSFQAALGIKLGVELGVTVGVSEGLSVGVSVGLIVGSRVGARDSSGRMLLIHDAWRNSF
jgi:hypothetical protein